MIIIANNQPLIFELGLKGQILLSQNTSYNEDDIVFLLYCGLISKQPNVSLEECKKIGACLSKKHIESLLQYIKDNYKSLSDEEIARLYSQSVGEVGIQPSDFYSMTLDEINWAYDGFIEKLEKEINLQSLAFKNAMKKDSKYISIKGSQDFVVGSKEERDQTLQFLQEVVQQ